MYRKTFSDFRNNFISSYLFIMSLLSLFTGCSTGSFSFNYGYNIHKGKVFYKQPLMQPLITMETADAESFHVISNPADSNYADNHFFGTDKHAVYYCGRIIEGSDGPSFQLLQINYSKDKYQVYYLGSPIPDADPKTFFIKDANYSGDQHHVFRRTATIDHDNTVFESFNDGNLVHTANAVSVSDEIISIPAGATFRYLSFNYFALNNQVYFYEKLMKDATTDGFLALDLFYAKTDKFVYYKDTLISNANPSSFQLLQSPYGPYSKDDKYVFFYEKEIEGADAKSFELLNKNYECSRDQHAVYFEDKKVKSFTKTDLVNKNTCISCDEQAVHFAE